MLFLEEIWSRNFTNLFIAPIKIGEIIISLVFTALIRSLIGLVPAILLTSPLFGISLMDLGIHLFVLFLSLYLFGITLGIFVSAGLLRFGPSFENIAWSTMFLLAPFGCIYYPIEILPEFFQDVARGLPLVYIFEEARSILVNQVVNYSNIKNAFILNAIYLSIQLINEIQTIQEKIKSESKADKEFEVPYTTIEVCKIQGGNAPNIVPNSASFLFEIRNIPKDDPLKILSLIKARGNEIISSYKKSFPEAEIQIDIINQYPSLNTPKDSDILNFLKSITGNNSTAKVSFGTEGGLYSNELNIPTAICGPGSMQQGHKPDEYIEVGQIEKCDLVLNNLLKKLEQGFTN